MENLLSQEQENVDEILNKFVERASPSHHDDQDDSFFYQSDKPKKIWGRNDDYDSSPNHFSRKS